MKKWTAMIVTLVLLAVIGLASATVPSISTGDTTQGGGSTASTGVAIEEGFVLEPTDTPETIQNEIQQMFDFVNGTDPQQPAAQYFSDEVQQMIAEKLPETVAADNLVVNEIVPLVMANYDSAYGDVTTEFTFATEYVEGETVVVLLGLIDVDGNIEWVAVDAVAVEGGGLAVTFPQDVLLQMEQATDIMMVVLSES